MTAGDPVKLASTLTNGEKAALLSLPARDRGHLSDETYWAYYSLLDAGLSASIGDFMMVPTPLGEAVKQHLAAAAGAEGPSTE